MPGIDHINIVVRDLDKVAAFFQMIGFVCERRDRLQGDWISQVVGLPDVHAEYIALAYPGTPTRLELIRYDRPFSDASEGDISVANRLGYRHIAVLVPDITAAVTQLAAAGFHCVSEPVHYDPTGKWLVYLRGPENILVELAAYESRGEMSEDK